MSSRNPKSDSLEAEVIELKEAPGCDRPDCPNYCQVAPHNRVAFNSAAQAAAAGYWVAENCP
jgi:hypothetical protein